MENLNLKQKVIFIIIISLMIMVIGYYFFNKTKKEDYLDSYTEENNQTINKQDKNNVEKIENTKNTILDNQEIIIHITGEVEYEGVINLKKGNRIADAINLAGGTTINADLTKVNLAYVLLDGQKIYIPNINEINNEINIIQENSEEIIFNNEEYEINIKNQKVNINKANQTELETLPGIGPSTALKIIEHRKLNGFFKNIEDIKNVPGIGQSKFDSMKEYISTE